MNPAAARELARLAVLTARRAEVSPRSGDALRLVAAVGGGAATVQEPVLPAESPSLPALSAGHPVLDAWLGGLPAGRIAELLGPASAGKTTLAMNALRSALHAPGRRRLAALVDLTRTVAPQEPWTRALLVVRPRRLELGLRALDVLLESAAFSLIVVHAPPSLRSLPDALRVRAARLCREAGTSLLACGEHAVFGSCSSLRIELAPGGAAVLAPGGARVIARVSKNRQGPVGEKPLAILHRLPGAAA